MRLQGKPLENSRLILLSSLDECMDFSNLYAPEHLIINTSEPQSLSEKVINAGSVFLGQYSCESAGDYASGTNHTLPTNGFARNYSGVSAESFLKKITFQEIYRGRDKESWTVNRNNGGSRISEWSQKCSECQT